MTAAGDAHLAAAMLALEPGAIGGVLVRARHGPTRDAWLALVAELAGPMVRLPPGLDAERLQPGFDPVASLAAGRAVIRPGLLDGGGGRVFLLPMAERLDRAAAAALAAVLDRADAPALVALDEGVDDEALPAILVERLGIHLTLADVPDAVGIVSGQADARAGPIDEAALHALVVVADALGVASPRALGHALGAARLAAALGGRAVADEDDLAAAARLVLAPRATRVPSPPDETPPPAPDAGEPDPDPATGSETITDRLVEAARAVLPPGLLADQPARARGGVRGGAKGGDRVGTARGRPLPARRGAPKGGARLALVDTLRAAAPWQGLRRPAGATAVVLRPEDLHVRRYREPARALTVLSVDASGSAALERLAEAKGAALLLLADAYVRRAEVAVIAFRGPAATIALAPTRSLVRAKRELAQLVGGGGTPLASGIDAALALALAARARGRVPALVFMTDGRANIGQGGIPGRAGAEADALAAARRVAAQGIAAAILDTAQRPSGHAQRLAQAMRARYAPLPRFDAGRVREMARTLTLA